MAELKHSTKFGDPCPACLAKARRERIAEHGEELLVIVKGIVEAADRSAIVGMFGVNAERWIEPARALLAKIEG